MTLLTNGVPSVSGCDDLAGKTVIDVGGCAPTADSLGYVTNMVSFNCSLRGIWHRICICPNGTEGLCYQRYHLGDPGFSVPSLINGYLWQGVR